jgi:hypothetical protein
MPKEATWSDALPSAPLWLEHWPKRDSAISASSIGETNLLREIAKTYAESSEIHVRSMDSFFPNLDPSLAIPRSTLTIAMGNFLAATGYENFGDLLDLPSTRNLSSDTFVQLEILILCQLQAVLIGARHIEPNEYVYENLHRNSQPTNILASTVLANFFKKLSEVQRTVAIGRFSRTSPLTLDSIGKDLGVSRERVRQIEEIVRQEFATFEGLNQVFVDSMNSLRALCAEPRTREILISRHPHLGDLVLGDLDCLDALVGFGQLMGRGGWYATDFKLIDAQFKEAVSNAIDGRLLNAKLLEAEVSKCWPEMPSSSLDVWMSQLNFQKILDAWVRNPRLVDFARLALTNSKTPLTVEQIVAKIELDINLRTLEAAMAQSDEFSRSGKSEWALAEWGLPEYKSIQDAIAEMVDREGSVPLDLVIARLLPTGVQENSIRTYATSPPFIVTDGMVRRSAWQKVVRKRVEQTRNLYYTQDGLLYRVKVTSEHLRGSGFACPAALAAYLGVTTGVDKVLQTVHGQFKVSLKGAMYHLPSIRKAALERSLDVGDEILLFITPTHVQFDEVALRESNESKIRSMLGLSDHAVGLDSAISYRLTGQNTKSLAESLELLTARGESDLASLVEELIKSQD